MNAKINFQTSVINILKDDINTMASDVSEFAVNPGKDFTRKRKMDFVNLILFLIVMGNSNTDYELVRYFNFNSEKIPGKSAFIQQRAKLRDRKSVCRERV